MKGEGRGREGRGREGRGREGKGGGGKEGGGKGRGGKEVGRKEGGEEGSKGEHECPLSWYMFEVTVLSWSASVSCFAYQLISRHCSSDLL